jgi:hypothetical protein
MPYQIYTRDLCTEWTRWHKQYLPDNLESALIWIAHDNAYMQTVYRIERYEQE